MSGGSGPGWGPGTTMPGKPMMPPKPDMQNWPTTSDTPSTTAPGDVDTQAVSSCVNLTTDLRYRMKDSASNDDISLLQDFLQSRGFLRSEPTGYLGLLTVEAVKMFQKRAGFSPTGFVGPLTRAKIKAITCDGAGNIEIGVQTVPPTTKPGIPPINPIKPMPPKPEMPHPNEGSIILITPNGGETLVTGTEYKIQWKFVLDPATTAATPVEIGLVPYYQPCTSNICPMSAAMYPYHAPYAIARGVSGDTYVWKVGSYMSMDAQAVTNAIPEGAYTIRVCRQGTGACDVSDSYFKISGNGPVLPPPLSSTASIKVLSPNGGEVLVKDQVYEVKWSSTGIDTFDVILDFNWERTGPDILLASGVVGSSYKWLINQNVSYSNDPYPTNQTPETFRIIVRKSCGTYVCGYKADGYADSSDATFTIDRLLPQTSGTATTPN
jgi:peptidoglycan hydrolase-like protein with peptidoglycan-binding domain